jgi:low affinity Fe/Cu permease
LDAIVFDSRIKATIKDNTGIKATQHHLHKTALTLGKPFCMNWQLIIIFGVAAVTLIIFLVVKNLKDKKELENKIKQDYKKPRDNEGDIEIEDPKPD